MHAVAGDALGKGRYSRHWLARAASKRVDEKTVCLPHAGEDLNGTARAGLVLLQVAAVVGAEGEAKGGGGAWVLDEEAALAIRPGFGLSFAKSWQDQASVEVAVLGTLLGGTVGMPCVDRPFGAGEGGGILPGLLLTPKGARRLLRAADWMLALAGDAQKVLEPRVAAQDWTAEALLAYAWGTMPEADRRRAVTLAC